MRQREEGRLDVRGRQLTVFRSRANEANRSWDDATNQQLVVEDCWSTFLVRIYLHMLLLEAFSAVVGALT